MDDYFSETNRGDIALSREEVEFYREAFSLMDPKGTGIHRDVIENVFKCFGASDEEVSTVKSIHSLSQSGQVIYILRPSTLAQWQYGYQRSSITLCL